MAEAGSRKQQTVVLTRLGRGNYHFALRGDFTAEELVFALEQVKAVLTGVVKDTRPPPSGEIDAIRRMVSQPAPD